MLNRALVAALLLAAPASAQELRQLDFQEIPRDYLYYRPAGATPEEPLPVMVVLPPAGTPRDAAFQRQHLKAAADAERVAVAVPQARLRNPRLPPHPRNNQQMWNDGAPWTRAQLSAIDDVAYLDTVLDDLIAKGGVDRSRIMMTGFSMGGSMALLYATRRGERLAAVGSVAGHLWGEARTALPVLVVAGAADPLWPLDGMEGKPAMRAEPARWASLAGCGATAESSPAPDVTRVDWQGCRDGIAVSLLVVAGLGHQWPGGEPSKAPHLGPYSAALDAGKAMAAFLRTHGRPAAAAGEGSTAK